MAVVNHSVGFASGEKSLIEALGIDIPSNLRFSLFEDTFADSGTLGDGGLVDIVSGNWSYNFGLGLDLVVNRPTFGTVDVSYPIGTELIVPDAVVPLSDIEISTSDTFGVNGATIAGTTVSLGSVALELDLSSTGAGFTDLSFFSTFFSSGFELDRDLVIPGFDTSVTLAEIDLGSAVSGEVFDGVTLSLGTPGGGGDPVTGIPTSSAGTNAFLPVTTRATETLFEISANPLEVIDDFYPALDVLTEDVSFSLAGYDVNAEYSIFAPFISAGYGIVQEYLFTPTEITTEVTLDGTTQTGVLGDAFSFDPLSDTTTEAMGEVTYGMDGTLQVSYSLAPIGSVGVTILGADVEIKDGDDTIVDVALGPVANPSISGTTDIGKLTLFTTDPIDLPDGFFPTFTEEFTVGLASGQDIAFVIDTTGSMSDDIASVKAQASSIIDAVFAPDRGLTDSRIAVVGYNDPTTETVLSFTDQPDIEDRKAAALSAINSLGASGGGDFPEMVYSGLLRALDGRAGSWREDAAARKIILFGDAPAKDGELRGRVEALARDLGASIDDRIDVDAFAETEVHEKIGLTEFTLVTEASDEAPALDLPVQIFTINIGGDPSTRSDFDDISAFSGGSSFDASDSSEIVAALLEVIELPIYSLTPTEQSTVEGTGGTTTINLVVSRDRADGEATAQLAFAGTATSADFSGPTEVRFGATETSKIVSLSIIGDNVIEADETLIVSIDSLDVAGTLSPTGATITIVDDDVAVANPAAPVNSAPILLTAPSYAVREGFEGAIVPLLATDADDDDISFSLSGDDAALFEITADGVAFRDPAYIDAPSDSDMNNVYQFTVQGSDERGGTDEQAIQITILDDPELDEVIIGTVAEDTLVGGLGDDQIDGLDGVDVATFEGAQSGYTLVIAESGVTVRDRAGTDGTDVLVNVETLAFADGRFDIGRLDGVEDLSAEQLTELIEIYIGYFNRAPDAEGLFFWGAQLANGMSFDEIADFFSSSAENQALLNAGLTSSEIVAAVYQNVLGREADNEGLAFWSDQLDTSSIGQSGLIAQIIDGAKAETGRAEDAAFISQKSDLGTYFAVSLGMNDVEDGTEAMAIFDGSAESLAAARAAIDAHYADATDETPEFLLQLVGVTDTPFADNIA